MSDIFTDTIFAYNYFTKESDSNKDINTLDIDNSGPLGILSDGTTMWVVDNSEKIFGYGVDYIMNASVLSSSQIELSWESVTGATAYIVSRSTELNGVFTEISTDNSTTITDEGLEASSIYYYKLAACTLVSDSTSCTEQYGDISVMTDASANEKQWHVALSIVDNQVQLALIAELQMPQQPMVQLPAIVATEQQANSHSGSTLQSKLHIADVASAGQCLVLDQHSWLQLTADGSLLDYMHSYRWGALVYGDWDQIIAYANSEQLCGFDDWRVPTVEELQQLRNSVDSFSQLQQQIPYLQPQLYWSSESSNAQYALAVDMLSAELQSMLQYHYLRLILVR